MPIEIKHRQTGEVLHAQGGRGMVSMPRSPADRMANPKHVARHILEVSTVEYIEPMDDQTEGFGLAVAIFFLGIIMAVGTCAWLYLKFWHGWF